MGGVMRLTPWNRRCGVLAVTGLIVTAITVPIMAAASAARVPGPVVKLVAAQRSITLDSFGGQVFLDPGVWVAAPGGPPTTPYPTQCASDPFQRAMVWGIQKGWAVDPTGSFLPFSRLVKLSVGVYQVTESISPAYARLFRISARDATATVKATVVKGKC